MSGDNVTADQITPGRGAVARKTIHGSGDAKNLQQVHERLEQIRGMLRQHAANLPLAPELAKRADKIAFELSWPEPDTAESHRCSKPIVRHKASRNLF